MLNKTMLLININKIRICKGDCVIAKFKVCFKGYAYVEADNKEQAEEMFHDDEDMYRETEVCETEEVDEFTYEI